MKIESQESLYDYVCKGNQSAIDFLGLIGGISQVWDDLIDCDAHITGLEVDYAFTSALISLPRNGFYRDHFHELQPIIENGIFNWMTATEFEQRDESTPLSYVLRDSVSDLITRCAFIIGGVDWARHCDPHVKRFIYGKETLSRYTQDLLKGKKHVNEQTKA